MAQYDFGWSGSPWRNRPMSTEIGDAGDPFRDEGPRMRDRPAAFNISQGPVRPQSTRTSGFKPLLQPLKPATAAVQPPTALPPTAPIGQMPSPQWANPPDVNDNRTTTMPARTEPAMVPGWSQIPAARTTPKEIPAARTTPKEFFVGRVETAAPSLQNLFMGRGDPVAPIPPARQFPRSTEAIGDQGDPILPASNRGRPNQYWGTKGTPSWSYSDGPLANIDVPAYSGQSASQYLKLLNSLGLGSFYRGQGHGPVPDPSVRYTPPWPFNENEEAYNRARQAYNRRQY